MCGSDCFQSFNDRARSSKDVAHRLLAWQVFSYDESETLIRSVSDRLHVRPLSFLDSNAEAPYIFNPALSLNITRSPYAVIDLNPNPKDVTFTGTMTPGRNGQSSQTLCSFIGGQHG